MKLSELFLNRFLYRETQQNIETKGSEYNAGNVIEADVPAVAAGGAAQDINMGNVTINGAQLTPGTYPTTVLDVSNWGWGQTCVFSSSTIDTVIWGAGSFKSADGTTYAISAGTTGAMTSKTYIYLDLLTSETVYQHSTTPGDSVGLGKVLIAVAENSTVVGTLATFNLSEATQIVGDNILANSINASKIVTGQLIVGTNVGLGTAQTASQVTTIVGDTVTTGFVNALYVVAGSVAAENITGTYITGKTIRTAASGERVQLDITNFLQAYDSNYLRMKLSSTALNFYSPSNGSLVTEVYGEPTGLYLSAVGTNGIDLLSNGTLSASFGSTSIIFNRDLSTLVANTYDLLDWRYLYLSRGVCFKETGVGGTDKITLIAPDTIAADYTLTLPTTAGASGEYLKTDGSGNLSWDAGGTGGANQALSNLTNPTAVNQHLIPGADSTYDLGASSGPLYWRNLYIDAITATGNIGAGGDITALGTAGGAHVTSANEIGAGTYISATSYVNGGTGFRVNGTEVLSTSRVLSNITSITGHFLPTSSTQYYLGDASYQWCRVYVSDNMYFRGMAQGINYFGYCSGTTISRTYTGGIFSLTNPSTGNYTITHNLNSSLYIAVVSAVRASGTGAYSAKVESFSLNSFNVTVFDDAGTAVNGDFTFILMLK